MALPSPGWVSTSQGAPIVPFPLPVPYRVVYEDSGFAGKPSAVGIDTRGAPSVVLEARARYMKVSIEVRNAYDVVLVDRIE